MSGLMRKELISDLTFKSQAGGGHEPLFCSILQQTHPPPLHWELVIALYPPESESKPMYRFAFSDPSPLAGHHQLSWGLVPRHLSTGFLVSFFGLVVVTHLTKSRLQTPEQISTESTEYYTVLR